MKFREVIGLLAQGKKMRNLAWIDDGYISLIDGDIIDEKGNSYNFVEDDIIDEWEEYIEPSEKKIEKLYDIETIRGDLSFNENWILEIVLQNRYKINELIERMNELCGGQDLKNLR